MLQTKTISVQVPVDSVPLYENASQEEREKIAWFLDAALKELFCGEETEEEENEAWSQLGIHSMAEAMEDEPDIYSIDDIKEFYHK